MADSCTMSSVPNISARTYCDDMSSVMMNMFLRLLKLQTQQPGEIEVNKHLPEVLREFGRDSRFSEELLEEAIQVTAQMMQAFLSPGQCSLIA